MKKQLSSLQRTMNKYGRYIEELEKEVAILKKILILQLNLSAVNVGVKLNENNKRR